MQDFCYIRELISEGEMIEVGIVTHLYQVQRKGASIEVYDGEVRKAIPHTKYMNVHTYEEFKKVIEEMFEEKI